MRYELKINGRCVNGTREKNVGIKCGAGVAFRALKVDHVIYKMSDIGKDVLNYINLTEEEYLDEIVSSNNSDATIELVTETFNISCSIFLLGIDKTNVARQSKLICDFSSKMAEIAYSKYVHACVSSAVI